MSIPRALGNDRFEKNKLVMHGKKTFWVPFDMPRSDIALLFQPDTGPKSDALLAAVEPFDVERNAVPLHTLKQNDTLWGKELDRGCDFKTPRCAVLRASYFHNSSE